MLVGEWQDAGVVTVLSEGGGGGTVDINELLDAIWARAATDPLRVNVVLVKDSDAELINEGDIGTSPELSSNVSELLSKFSGIDKLVKWLRQ